MIRGRDTAGQAAAFLDRDGTIVLEKNYLSDPKDVALEVNAACGLRRIQELGYSLVVISNQSGIGRGYFSFEQCTLVNKRIEELLGTENVFIAGWYICPHAPNAGCDCRKPKPELLDRAARELDIDFARSFVVGDNRTDLGLAQSRQMKGFLLKTGHGEDHANWAQEHGFTVHADLSAVAAFLEHEDKAGFR